MTDEGSSFGRRTLTTRLRVRVRIFWSQYGNGSFVKHKGKIPAKFAKRPVIRKKWKAVDEIVKRVAAGKR